MTKWILAAGAAAMALAVPALSQPGGKGGGHGGGGGGGPKPAKVERGGGGGGGHGGGGGQVQQAQRVDHSGHGGGKRAEAPRRQEVRTVKVERKVEARSSDRADLRGKDRAAARGTDRLAKREIDRSKSPKANADRLVVRDERGGDRAASLGRLAGGRNATGLVDGCPPGLAMKNNGCLPPGQARKLVGAVLPAAFGANMLEGPFRQWYQDNDEYYYRNDGDYIYRVRRDGGLVDALMPYGSQDFGYYPVGMTYPVDYNFYNVPDQYRPYYADSSDYLYRYGNNAIYQVDPQTNAIEGIAALLAGDLSVGQSLPSNYSMYNVPLAYRDRYYDSPDAMYRYNDGYIYRADPKTQLITAVIDAIV